jgi:membrane protease YdiL (CAAX protease family)
MMFQNTEMLNEAKKAKLQLKLYWLLPIIITYFFAFFMMPQMILGTIFNQFPVSDTVAELSNLFINIVTILVGIFICTKIERRSLASMGFTKEGIGKRYLVGLVMGALLLLALVGGAVLLNAVKIESGTISPVIILYFLAFIIQGMSEEVALRGFFMVSATNRIPIPAAILISSLVFAIPHFYFSGGELLYSINTLLGGILLSTYILKTGHIWGASGFHTGLNFFGRCIFGAVGSSESLFTVTSNLPGKELIGGNDYGISSGLIFTALTILFTLGIYFFVNKSKKETPIPAYNKR